MNILLIDGEYLRKSIPLEKLENLIKLTFGIINYPEKIIYYSAFVDTKQTNILSNIKNMEINNKGYITQYDDGRRVQKAVDGYIIADIISFSSDKNVKDISVIAGDGDLIAAFEKSVSTYNKKINLISKKHSVSEKLISYSKVFYIDDINSDFLIEEETSIENILCENEINLKNLWEEEKNNDNWLSGSKIGQKRKLYHFKYAKGKLNNILKSLKEKNIIELRAENGNKTSGYDIKFI